MLNGYTVRQMASEDYERVSEIWINSEGICLRSDDSKENIARYLRHNPGMSFVAEFNNKITGAVLCGHDTRRGYLYHLAVDKSHRKKGLGRELVQACLHALKQAGIDKCHIFVLADNQEGLGFWRNIGWELRKDIQILSKSI